MGPIELPYVSEPSSPDEVSHQAMEATEAVSHSRTEFDSPAVPNVLVEKIELLVADLN